MSGRFCALMMGFLAVATPTFGGDRRPEKLIITNPGDALGETPIVIEVDSSFREGVYGSLLELHGETGKIFTDNGKTYFAAILPKIQSGEQTLPLGRGGARTASIPVTLTETKDSHVDVLIRGQPLTTLRNDLGPKPILYPLVGPGQRHFTRDFPLKDVPGEDKDHPHHRSFWFTHGNVNGVDFWSEAKGHGSIQQTAILSKQAGRILGWLRTSDDWLDADGRRVCEDERLLKFYPLFNNNLRMFDFEVTIKATDGPVTFGDTKEGMFGMRLASSMDVTKKTGGKIVNAEGITDTAAWGKASPWVDYSGPIDGKTVGVAIFDHPTSFRHPTTWHVRDYGLFAANPFGWHDFGLKKSGAHTIPAGESITFKYRIILHEGDAKAAGIPDAYRAYATRLKVEVK